MYIHIHHHPLIFHLTNFNNLEKVYMHLDVVSCQGITCPLAGIMKD